MASHSRLNRRLILPFALAVVLAGEVTGLALAVRLQPLPAAAPTASVSTSLARQHAGPATSIVSATTLDATIPPRSIEPGFRASSATPAAPQAPPLVAPVAKSTPAKSAPTASSYRGRNHVWIPTLGINRSIASFPCSRSRPPDNYVYRWGCAGTNNVYLLGHAYSVFKPLHDAYVGGRLKKGMKVFYADGNGRVRTYAVVWWKVTAPTTSASWAWAAQSRPSMTLQTCLGANSEYRLMVRLVAVN
jgi:Sortase domain